MAATYIRTRERPIPFSWAVSARWWEKLAEAFWFSLCLALFMVLGPFAAPVALCFIFSNRLMGTEMREPEVACEGR